MKSTLKKYQETLKKLIIIAEIIHLPYYHLLQHQKEIEKNIQQSECIHHKLVMHQQNENVRIWKCAECGKIIDYETI